MRADSFDNILKKIDSSMTSSDKGNYIYRFMFITIQDLDTHTFLKPILHFFS